MSEIRIGIAEWCSPVPGPAACRAAAECGLDGVEPDLGELRHGLPLSDPSVQRYWLDAQQKYAVGFPALAVNTLGGHCCIRPESPAQEELCRTIVSAAVDAAAALGIEILQIPNFGKFMIQDAADLDCAARFYQWACETAESRNILIGSESTLNAEENLQLYEKVNRPNYRIYYDNENAVFFRGEDPVRLLETLGSRVCQIHLKDGSSQALSSRPLGEGHGQAEACLNAMKHLDYSGWVVLENDFDTEAFSRIGRFEAVRKDADWLKARLRT